MFRRIRSITGARDAGSALVVAIAVAVIGIALATVVVSQAMVVMNDAARDRIRTVEIHSAEAALDATFKILETATPCTRTTSMGEAPKAVTVTVSIQYYNASGLLTCTNGTLSGKPTKAVVTSSAEPTEGGTNGSGTQRQIQSTVNLVTLTQPSFGAAVFAGGNMGVSNSGIIEPLDPNFPAQVWINGSSWSCPNTYTIDGDVIIPSGNATMSNSCRIKGNLWVKSGITAANTVRIDKNTVVYAGNVQVSNSVYFGGNLSVGGTYNYSNTPTIVGTLCSTNRGGPCGTLPYYAPKLLPEVDYKLSDWTAAGFTGKSKADFGNDVVSQLTFSNTWAKPQYLANPCNMNNTLPNPVKLPAGNFVYDLTTCDFQSSNSRTIEVKGDVAIFAKSFNTSNQFLVKSGDGQPHSVWFIVPDGGTAANNIAECSARGSYSPGGIQFSNQTDIAVGIDLFTYTPCDTNISNTTALRGQIYARNVTTANNFHLLYSAMGIPGVDLGGTPTTAPAGYKVEIVNKHEIQN